MYPYFKNAHLLTYSFWGILSQPQHAGTLPYVEHSDSDFVRPSRESARSTHIIPAIATAMTGIMCFILPNILASYSKNGRYTQQMEGVKDEMRRRLNIVILSRNLCKGVWVAPK